MKSIALAVALLAMGSTVTEAASLIASYSLDGTAADATGIHDDISLVNAPFEQGGVFVNGVYVGSGEPDACDVRTPQLSELDLDSFTISLEFKMGDLPEGFRPIFTGGLSWRWLGAAVDSNGSLRLVYNNTTGAASNALVSLDDWHRLVVSYDGATARVVMDGVLYITHDFDLEHGNDFDVSASNGGQGTTFKGHLRNLRVYNGLLENVAVAHRSMGSVRADF